MITRSFGFDKKLNIHARPAAMLARLASGFESMIFFSAGDQVADAKNAMNLLEFFSENRKNFDLAVMGADEMSAITQMEEMLMSFQ
jgi:phosphocarrier protein